MDVEVVSTSNTAVHDEVLNCSSPEANLDPGSEQVEVGEYGNHATFEQPSLSVNSVVKGLDRGYRPGFSVPEHLEHRTTNDLHKVDANMVDIQEVQEAASTKEAESQEEQEVYQELISDSARSQSKEAKSAKRAFLKSGSLVKDYCVSYELPPENEGQFAVFDLVWGKVKSHPWWPGQIFHPSDSSEKAMKYYKKGCYLVAYFGDHTFAWNDASVLKPFGNHFPQAERQNNTEAFQNAVNCALEEVSRRVELGLACSCASDESFDKIKYQIVENFGIREESSKREGIDRSTGVGSFEPDKLTDYVRALALFPTSGVNRLELVVAKAQLLALNQRRGYDALADFSYYVGLGEFDADTLLENQKNSCESGLKKKGPRKRKHDLKDIVYQRRKEKSVLELMGDTMCYLDGEIDSYDDEHNINSPTVNATRRALKFLTDDFTAPQRTKTISVAKVSEEAPPSHQRSFKVGERIRRAAFLITGSTPIVKGSIGENDKHSGNDADEMSVSPDCSLTNSTTVRSRTSSLEDMLSQLHLSAQYPLKGYRFLADIIHFFSEFRNLAVTTQRQKLRKRKKKCPVPVVGSPPSFEFDDRKDSYWTDMVVQGDAEAKSSGCGRKKKNELVVSNDNGKPLDRKPRKYNRKQYYQGNHESVAAMPTMDEKQLDHRPTGDDKQLNLPTELVLKFAEMGSVPSEVNLNRMFRCFGPLKELETEVDRQSSSARVVFKKRSDAEVAYSSAVTFNIFGSTLVNYQLNYTPASIRISAFDLTNGKEDAT